MARFARYIGVDYSGAGEATSGRKGLRVFMAEAGHAPAQILPVSGRSKYWTRRDFAAWLTDRLHEEPPTLAGLDHGFSFPMDYFERYGLASWPDFLDHFSARWPALERPARVAALKIPEACAAMRRCYRLTEIRVGAKSVFHFGVPGQVAYSTHAGLVWLTTMRKELGERVHVWPFDGWSPPLGRSVLAETYPTLCRERYPLPGSTPDEQDAYALAAWMQDADRTGKLDEYMAPELSQEERDLAQLEGWILGVS